MRTLHLVLIFLTVAMVSRSQQRIFIYPSAEPVMNKGFDTIAPFMDYYPSKNPSKEKTAVLICPGGGYAHLAWEKEGVLPARFFISKIKINIYAFNTQGNGKIVVISCR